MCLQMVAPADPGGAIADASREIHDQRHAAVVRQVSGMRTRRRIAAVDEMIAALEERHLVGERTFDRVLRQRLHHVEREVGSPLPRKAVRARNTVRLHAALLDWQETLLDEAVPERQLFPDAHDSDWNSLSSWVEQPVHPAS